jgi:hypothetical protein
MTIRRKALRKWSHAIGGAALVAAGWLAVVLGLTFISPPGQAMAIVGPPARAIAAIGKANGRVLSAGSFVTIARSDQPGFAARLYAAGALLVLDAEQAGGCGGGAPRRANASL